MVSLETTPTSKVSHPFNSNNGGRVHQDLRRPNREKLPRRSLLPVNSLWEIKQVEVQIMQNRPSHMLTKRSLETIHNTLPLKIRANIRRNRLMKEWLNLRKSTKV